MLSEKIKHKFYNLSIGLKISMFYFGLIVVSTCLSSWMFNKIYLDITHKKVSEVSIQTLNSIQSNINLMINNVDSYSKMILSDSDLQNLLRKGNVYSDLNVQSKVSNYLYKFIQAIPLIKSVYVFDNTNNIYSVGAQILPTLQSDQIKYAEWYKEVVQKKGGYILRLNGGGIAFHNTQDNYVSLIRLIRDMDTTDTLGILVINIPEKAFSQAFSSLAGKKENNVVILNEHNEVIISNFNTGKIEAKQVEQDKFIDFESQVIQAANEWLDTTSATKMKKIDQTEYLVSYVSENKYNWKLVSIMPFAKLFEENAVMSLVGFVIILFNSIVLFISAVSISRLITTPIKDLLNSMKDVEKGVFNEVQVKTQSREFKRLCKGYNIMIMEIKKLIGRVIEEQKIIRKTELYTLQAQIKPHFLYNTLDSINSLVLSECTEEASSLVEALGNYYRASVSKGKEIITIGEEINMVKNYLKIQQVRYPDLFTVKYDINTECLDYKVPKLILQPLVENALYHGIRPLNRNGIITVGADKQEGVVRLWVQDDGVGIKPEQLDAIINSKLGEGTGSFGLKGTLERIRIIYNGKNAFEIKSKPHEGTEIILYVHNDNEEED
ncbi:cache domain-containing sensor histidine kinase [Cellulosilyticum sp. I15G10I2]|uniref:cache domain-containing sensor histidine kinase n=1 Tax=Cellulosilyticum sp. I15G10I2 TaxID=1892843 RepID=UPI00085BC49E|nr:sensor histidine kinase [Cellulosilyticum sp. I15G10I2]